MNELNPLEAQLKSWKGRAPSPRIEAYLFHSGSRPVPATGRELPEKWIWWAPATACVLSLGLLFSSASLAPSTPLHARAGGPFLATMFWNGAVSSNFDQTLWSKTAYVVSKVDLNLEWNLCVRDTFEWTNSPQTPSSIPSLPMVVKTNHLLR